MSDTASGGVRITNREVYDQVMQVSGKVDLLVQRDTEADAIHRDFEERLRVVEGFSLGAARRNADADAVHVDIEKRTRRLESLSWKLLGALALVTLFFSSFGYFIAQAVVHR